MRPSCRGVYRPPLCTLQHGTKSWIIPLWKWLINSYHKKYGPTITTLKFLSLKKNLDLELNTRLEIGAPFTITWRRAEPWTHSIIIHQKICRKKEKWGKTCLLALEHTLLLGSLCSMYSQQTIIIWHEKNEATEHREEQAQATLL